MALFALALIKSLENSAPPSHHGLYLFQNLDNLWTLQRVVVAYMCDLETGFSPIW